MRSTGAVLLLFLLAVAFAFAQDESDCPQRTVINNGVCVGNDGKDCSKREAQSRVCFDPDPQYTEQAANSHVKGTVRLTATIDAKGCAKDIRVVTTLGYGLDESSVSALQRWRFRKPPKPMQINVEFNFDPRSSSQVPTKAATCDEVAARPAERKRQRVLNPLHVSSPVRETEPQPVR
jgi:TonB family protein